MVFDYMDQFEWRERRAKLSIIKIIINNLIYNQYLSDAVS